MALTLWIINALVRQWAWYENYGYIGFFLLVVFIGAAMFATILVAVFRYRVTMRYSARRRR